MSQEQVPMTKEGVSRLQQELEGLKADRKVVADHIHKARELGTSQNDAEYDNAKQEQSLLEGKILNLEDLLRRAVIIDEEGAHPLQRVWVGTAVKVRQGRKPCYQDRRLTEATRLGPHLQRVSHRRGPAGTLEGRGSRD